MGENTPEAVEITCPGCKSHFRLTPKNGRLPTDDVPCPKCSEPIPVPAPKPVKADSDLPAIPAFGVMSKGPRKRPSEDSDDDNERAKTDQALLRLEQLAAQFPMTSPTSTMAGLPGRGGNNPFATSREEDKTASISPSILEDLAIQDTSSKEQGPRDLKASTHPWEDSEQPTTSPRLVPKALLDQLAGDDSEVALATTEIPPEDTVPRGLLSRSFSSPFQETSSNLTETAEHRVPPSLMVQEETREHDTRALKAQLAATADLPAPKRQDPPQIPLKAAPEDTLKQERSQAPTRPASPLRAKLAGDEGSTATQDDQGADEKPSLAKLFQKARQRDKKSGGKLRAKLRAEREGALADKKTAAVEPAKEKELIEGIEISVDELSEIVERTTSSPGLPKPALTNPIWPPMPAITEDDRPQATTTPPAHQQELRGSADTENQTAEHSGLFDGFDASPSEPERASSAKPGEVSKKRGKTTTHSTLARLQRRPQRGSHVDHLEVGSASERRGSGYIRLPTSEIQEVLGQGDFRLRIQNVIYEPVDREGLIQLIKSGVLLGAEEIAEADGDWMPVSEHPVFGDLRRRMAAEAHQVLARLGATRRAVAVQPPPKPETPPLSRPATPQPSTPVELALPPETPTPQKNKSEESAKFQPPAAAEPAPQKALPQEADKAQADEAAPPAIPDIARAPSAEEVTPPTPSHPPEAPNLEDSEETPPAEPDEAPEENRREEPRKVERPEERPTTEVDSPLATTIDEAHDFDLDLPKRKGKTGLILAILAVLIGLGAAFFALGDGLPSLTQDSSPAVAVDTVDDDKTLSALKEVISKAKTTALSAIPDAFSDESRADAWVRQQLEADASTTASEVLHAQWQEGRQDREFLLLFLDVLLQDEDYLTARRVALAGVEYYPGDGDFVDLHRRAVREDKRLTSFEPTLLFDNEGFEANGLLNEQGQRGFILTSDQGRQIFKPARQDWTYGWRAEIAAWRFCELVACHFAIPRTEPAVMSRAFLESLGGDSQGYDGLASSALWVTMEVDGEEIQVMRGSLEFLPEGEPAPFPIEYRPLWLNWLHAGAATDGLSAPFDDSIEQLASLADGAFVDGLKAQLGQHKTAQIARQVSSLLIFDYLTNNWERFATSPEDYGAKNPAIDGLLYSRYNGDAFQPRASRRVQGRFEWTTRFSQSMVTTIRGLDPDLINSVLFPDELIADRPRQDVMWSQRRDFLRRLDDLIDTHGDAEILAFP